MSVLQLEQKNYIRPVEFGGLNPSFFVIWGLSPPSPYVEPPLLPAQAWLKRSVETIPKRGTYNRESLFCLVTVRASGTTKSSLVAMFPLIFLKSVCAKNFFCATFYLNSAEFRILCMKFVQNTFLEGTFMRAPRFLVCAPLTTCVRTRAHAPSLEEILSGGRAERAAVGPGAET